MALPMAPTKLPTTGVFPVQIGDSLAGSLGIGESGKKRKRATEEVIALRYAFKPASIVASTPGTLELDGSGGRQLVYDLPGGAQQVFDSREEGSKSRECVLIWDDSTQTFTLHALPITLHLTLNRSASSSRASGRRPTSTSAASTSSTSSIPLSRARTGTSKSTYAEADSTTNSATMIEATIRPTKGGKGLPRKALPAQPPPASKVKGRGKGMNKKTKEMAVPKGKIKSVEIIEDSDEEAEGGAEENDEFAKMVGQMVAGESGQGGGGEEDDEDDSDEEEEEDDDDDYLGGTARVAHSGPGQYGINSEWL